MIWLKRIGWTLVLLYILVCGLMYSFQESLIFHPRFIPSEYSFDWGTERTFTTNDGASISTVWVDNPGNEVVIYFHGNVGDANRARYQIRQLIEESDYDAVVLDYRSFGKSSGKPTGDHQLIQDAQLVYDQVKTLYPEQNIHLLGYSLGTGMATQLAAHNSPSSLNLVAPYTSLVDMKNLFFWWVPDFLLKYELNTAKTIAEVSCPVNIFHGEDDKLIPIKMAESIASAAPANVRLKKLSATGHRGAILSFQPAWIN